MFRDEGPVSHPTMTQSTPSFSALKYPLSQAGVPSSWQATQSEQALAWNTGQGIFVRSTDPISGSADTNLVAAGVPTRKGILVSAASWSSTLTPSQTFSKGQYAPLLIAKSIASNDALDENQLHILSARLVKIMNLCCGHLAIVINTSLIKLSLTFSWNMSLIELTNTRRGRFHLRGSPSFSMSSVICPVHLAPLAVRCATPSKGRPGPENLAACLSA